MKMGREYERHEGLMCNMKLSTREFKREKEEESVGRQRMERRKERNE